MKKIIYILPTVCIVLLGLITTTQPIIAEENKSFLDNFIESHDASDLPSVDAANEEIESVLIGQAIASILGMFGIIFFILMIYGGFIWMKAQGRDEEVEKGRNIIQAAVIGLCIVLISYFLSSFVVSSVQQAAAPQI